jgi:DNA polymerase-1
MRLAGVHMDMAALEILKKQLTGDVEAAKGRAFKAAGREFNFNSNPEKVKLLFGPKEEGGQGLRPKVFTATGNPSASEDALKHFPRNELVKHMIEAADVNKLMNTFVIPYAGGDVVRTTNGKSKIETRDSVIINGKIHTEFVQNGTETGRFSSRNPNLQQVPNPRTERGKAIRNLFVAGPGNVLVVADYGQIEPRVTAAFSGDPTMMNSFINNEDIYTAIASPFGLDRAAGKVLVLSMLYGVGADKTAESLGVSVRKAEQIMSDFDKHFPAVDKFRKQVIRDARSRAPVPYVRTMLGRRRYLPDLRSSKFGLKMRAQRQAFNAVIQGSSADIIKFAMVRAHRMIPDEAQLILTIHDELVTQTPVELADETYAAIREAMEGFNPLKTVPLVADIKVVDTWGAAK